MKLLNFSFRRQINNIKKFSVKVSCQVAYQKQPDSVIGVDLVPLQKVPSASYPERLAKTENVKKKKTKIET